MGIGLLYLLLNASSVTVLGCMIDGALPSRGRGCVYDIQLLNHHLDVDKLARFDTEEEQKEGERCKGDPQPLVVVILQVMTVDRMIPFSTVPVRQ